MDYQRPYVLFNRHIETIFPSLLRTVELPAYTRERISTPDEDFLDLDWLTQQSEQLVILSHGLEGNSLRPYVKGMAKVFFQNGYDVLAWNYRGCSEEMNRRLRFYHSGATDDLDVIVKHAISKKYDRIVLAGFSLGGNLTLKYCGERKTYGQVKKAIAFSVPLHLHSSCIQISKSANWIYSQRFLKSLKKKVIQKAEVQTDLDIKGIDTIKTLIDFDDRYTSQLHGYEDAIDYYTKCSSLHFLDTITVPTLIVNAANDPFLSTECFPTKQLKTHRFVQLEIPRHGGHVGFAQFDKKGLFWSEERAIAFATHD